jgi:hypothetical protein
LEEKRRLFQDPDPEKPENLDLAIFAIPKINYNLSHLDAE